MAPAQSAEAAVIAVGRDPFAPRLDRQRGKVRVGHQVAAHAAVAAETLEDVPMPGAGPNVDAIRLAAQLLDKLQRIAERGRLSEYLRVGNHAQEAAQYA